MDEHKSKFRAAALASRLLTDSQLDEAIAAVRAEGSGGGPALVQVTDDQLADKLVGLERLNQWQAEQLKAGRTKFNLNEYQIVDSLGQGGMGQVFKAEHSLMGRVVAIKVLPKSRSTPDAIASFQHEIRALASLDDPNLVRAYDAGHDGNVYFLVTEFVPGLDLRRLVRARGPLSQRDAATIIAQAARGLQHAHEQGLIHRDVKPGNLMVTPEGKTKVLDLGLAGFLLEDAANPDPRKGRIVGTADYLAPEQILSPRSVTAASDIYSLGCTLYYAVTGEVPFPGGTTQEKCYRHLHEPPLHPRRFNQDLSDAFLDVLAELMEKDAKKRIASASEVAGRMMPWVEDAVEPPLAEEELAFARLEPPPPPVISPLDDTQDFPELSPGELESPSQMSQGTEAVNQAGQETSPAIDKPPPLPTRKLVAVESPPPAVSPWILGLAVIFPLFIILAICFVILRWLLH